MNSNTKRVIVVGVDGSPSSLEALTWAAEQATMRGAILHVVRVWSMQLGGTSIAAAPMPEHVAELSRNDAEAMLRTSIEQTLGDHPNLEVRVTAAHGNVAKVLMDTASKDHAEMLVVASRGNGGFKRLLLGSVSSQCAAHASCPVTVIHPQSD